MCTGNNTIKFCLFLCGLLSACASPVSVSQDASSADVVTLPGFGEACTADGRCGGSLVCQDSEYAPFPWCTQSCSQVKAPCERATLGGKDGLCIQMPSGWNGPKEPFCAPTCGNSSACTALDKRWEACERPAYKKLPLYGDVGKVCQAPSANGQIHVDPVTCDWESKITDPKVQELKGICKQFCSFLTTCQMRASGQTDNCCTWQCFRFLTPSGSEDVKKRENLLCYTDSFTANAQNPNICSAYVSDCGPLCKSDTGCSDSDPCTSDTCVDWHCVNRAIDGCK